MALGAEDVYNPSITVEPTVRKKKKPLLASCEHI